MKPEAGWVEPLSAALDLVLPVSCAGCRRPGDRWCPACRAALAEGRLPGGAAPVRPQPCPAGLPAVYAAAAYGGPLRKALVALKEEDRWDVVAVLAPLLADAVSRCVALPGAALGPAGAAPALPSRVTRRRALVVPVPSSATARRRRGGRPVDDLARAAVAAAEEHAELARGRLRIRQVLRLRRAVADQAALNSAQRAANLRGAMEVVPADAGAVAGASCIVVDDVLTTGATLAEATRALRAAGAEMVVGAVLAVTRRRSPP